MVIIACGTAKRFTGHADKMLDKRGYNENSATWQSGDEERERDGEQSDHQASVCCS